MLTQQTAKHLRITFTNGETGIFEEKQEYIKAKDRTIFFVEKGEFKIVLCYYDGNKRFVSVGNPEIESYEVVEHRRDYR